MCACETTKARKRHALREKVRKGYGAVASQGGGCCGPSCGCDGENNAADVARAVGYTESELKRLPVGANMGLSCGNPGAIAALKKGEVVLDLGSGGGLDVFLAARKVGSRGRAIGVDMTPEMLSKARENAVIFEKQSGLNNVEFRLGEIEHLPVADACVDVVISNCVINLSPDKPQVWREIARILRPGGRVAVSDMALRKRLPPGIEKSVEALIGCVAGAVLIDETRAMMKAAGLVEISMTPRIGALDGMLKWGDSIYRRIRERLPGNAGLGAFVASFDMEARRPETVRRTPLPRCTQKR